MLRNATAGTISITPDFSTPQQPDIQLGLVFINLSTVLFKKLHLLWEQRKPISSRFYIISSQEASCAKNRQDVRPPLCSLLHLITPHTGTPTFQFLFVPPGAKYAAKKTSRANIILGEETLPMGAVSLSESFDLNLQSRTTYTTAIHQ